MSEETTSTSVESHSDVEMMTGEQQRASSPAGQAVSDRENPSPTTPTPLSPATQQKVEVRLQAAGDAPIMKQKNYKVDGDKKIEWILTFIRKYLKIQDSEHLFVYVNQAFSPSPDQTVRNICECFGSDGKLVLYYSKSQMWG